MLRDIENDEFIVSSDAGELRLNHPQAVRLVEFLGWLLREDSCLEMGVVNEVDPKVNVKVKRVTEDE
jgi:hypothetical protein